MTNRKRILTVCSVLTALMAGFIVGAVVMRGYIERSCDEQTAAAAEQTDVVASAMISSIANPSDEKIDIQAPAKTIKYEMLDSHLHYLDFLQKSDGFNPLVQAMDASGVKDAIIFGMPMAKQWDETMKNPPTYYLSNDSRCYYYPATDFILAEELLAQPEEIRERFYPFICGVNTNDRFAADHIRQMLNLYPDFWCGIGEIMSRHDDLTALTYGEAPHINSQTFKDIFDLGAEYDLPVLVHHNITGQNIEDVIYLDELKEALAYNRDCNIIWAHMGISRRVEIKDLAEIVDSLLDENPNLYVDISWVVYDYYFMDGFPDNYPDTDDIDEWVSLVNKHPDRIMIGTDKVGHWATYPEEVFKYYDLLERLDPEVAQKICRDNALSLIKRYDKN